MQNLSDEWVLIFVSSIMDNHGIMNDEKVKYVAVAAS